MRKSVFPHYLYVDPKTIPDPFGYGEEAIQAIRSLKHGNSTAPGHAFELPRFYENLIRWTYGPCHENGHRIAKTVFLMVGRGARKTSLCASLALLHTIGPEARQNGEVYFAAYNRTQAGIGFKQAANIIRMDKRLASATKIYDAHNSAKMIACPSKGTELKTLTSDGGAAQGLTPAFALMDEIHEWKNRALYDAIEEGLGKTPNTLKFIATTAGAGQEGVAFEVYDYACKVARGDIEDPSFLPVIFQAEPGDEWDDEATWHKANPGLKHGFPDIENLRIRAQQAKHSPGALASFKRFRLNIWQSHSSSPLFNMETYDASLNPHFDLADLEELPCYLGVDLSINGDITAVVGAWRHDDGTVSVHPWFFVPGEDLRTRAIRDGVPYEKWRDDGLITAIDGPIIEPDVIEAHIKELCARFDVREIAFDPHLARQMMQHLHDEGLPAVEFRQTLLNMGLAYGTLERVVNGRGLTHGGHNILRHHFDSVVAVRSNDGRVKALQDKKTNRIDGADAAAMAVFRAAANDNQRSIFDLDPDEFDRLRTEAEAA
ncbi:terminase TerL endonuclease subunit [Sinorhizobium medicae]|uniref:terminase large subunit n=1 Tax=Sinorhizobium medicae TaxID=110321 RepID=UPI002AF6AD73|nr:terminase TerL endonuclease subunit [Sinorhizobium medicae]WQO87062.1 terminase TerL endonuclease subunit [Sinorhizobium medicae]